MPSVYCMLDAYPMLRSGLQPTLHKQSERVDVARMLRIGAALEQLEHRAPGWSAEHDVVLAEMIPELNNVDRRRRGKEIRAVMAFWGVPARDRALLYGASWHALVYPAILEEPVDSDEVNAWVLDRCHRYRLWPSVGLMRRHLGHPSNHEVRVAEGQASLGLEGRRCTECRAELGSEHWEGCPYMGGIVDAEHSEPYA